MSFIQTVEAGIDYFASRVFAKVELFGTPVEGIILWLAVPMVFFTALLGLPQLRAFGHALRLAARALSVILQRSPQPCPALLGLAILLGLPWQLRSAGRALRSGCW
jgi:hypothetical protein